MADHLSYEDSKKAVVKGLILLAVVTLVEVFFSLAGKAHIPGLGFLSGDGFIGYIVPVVLIVLSLYKAYFIIYDFMHMRFEVKAMAMTILLPMLLLVWGLIAFLQEGNAWKASRTKIIEKNSIELVTPTVKSPIEKVQKSHSTDHH